MLRWAISDYSDDEKSIREEEEEEESQDHNTIDNNITIENESNLNIMQKRIIEIKDLLDEVLFCITNNQIQKSHEKFVKLQKIYNQRPKVIKKNKIPHFFIYKLFKITQKINNLSKNNKNTRRVQKEITKFCHKFEKELSECQLNEQNFANEDNDFKYEEYNNNNKTDINDWFLPSDNADSNELLNDNTSNSRNNDRNQKTNANNRSTNNIENICINNDENIKKELDKYCLTRSKGRISTNIDHLYELYQKVTNKGLAQKIQLEICYTIEDNSFDQVIPFDIWKLILDIMPNLINDAKRFVPLFEKLNKDFWKHSINSSNNFAFNISHFYEILSKYISNMELFAKLFQNDNEQTLFVRLETILIEHLYFKENFDIMDRALNIINC